MENPFARRVLPWPNQVARLAGALLISLILVQIPLHYVESLTYDMRMRLRKSPEPSGNVELIVVRSSTVKKYNALPGFSLHTQLLQKIKTAGPKAVVYIRKFAPLKEDPPEARVYFAGTAVERLQFVKIAKEIPGFSVQTDDMAQAGEIDKLVLVPPFQDLKVLSGPKSTDRNLLAKDSVTRRTLINYQDQPLMHVELARLFNPKILPSPTDTSNINGVFDLFDSKQVYIDFCNPGAFSQSNLEDVLDGKVDLTKFKDKIVLIGDDVGTQIRDYVSTPLNREKDLPVIELHANMIDALIRNSAPVQSPKIWDYILTFVLSALTIFVVLTLKPLRGIVILLGLVVCLILVSCLFFIAGPIWIPLAHALSTIFVCYYFLIPYRLIIENKLSWEYYQKNKLLQEVEQLKTNFISMMSHDLKTPIARIQGMTDLIRKDRVVLSAQQLEAVDTIRSSAGDLLSFINSILNYARIESEGIALHKEPKDLNQLLEDVIRRHDFMAKVKGMKIEREFEPLFSISVDPELVRQIFSNLLENALKYSPEGSTVKITSKEVNSFVQVDFVDEGSGIAPEDLDFLFMKFFRSKDAKSSPIKGSGLGLYLTKYFTELHGGHVFVTSTLGKGSCFTVQLPLKM